ncbi:tetratricopeptide repeat protein [Rhodoflexus caldus]|uniref:tetratricopeptide repeat protein n=1 Tax=Rhodoflexus caldus TaxID=2891236 RepID=UPI00202A7BEA|nr:tetratricopeptide repeat protein [Rhodoflexus caldus]
MKNFLSTVFAFSLWLMCSTVFAQQEGLAHYVDGENLRRSGQHEKAINEFNKALQREPNNYNYLFARAQSEYQIKRMDAALSSLQSTLKLKNDFVPAYVLLATIYRAKNDITKAGYYYEQAFNYETDINKKVQYKMFAIQAAIREGNWTEAYQKAADARRIAPDNEMVAYYVARLANKISKYQEAINAVTAVESKLQNMKIDQNAKFYYELGYAYYHLDEFDKANAAWKKADFGPYKARMEKFSAKYFCNVSHSYFKVYENDLAKQYAEKAGKVEKGNSTAYVLLAQIAKRNTEHSNTIANLKTAVEATNDRNKQLPLYVQLAELELSAQNYDNALAAVQEALKISPAEPKSVMFKGIALYKKGEYKAAIDFIQSMLTNQRFDAATTAEMNFLMGLAGKKFGDIAIARQGFSMAMRSSLKDAAEIELRALRDAKAMEEDSDEDIIKD